MSDGILKTLTMSSGSGGLGAFASAVKLIKDNMMDTQEDFYLSDSSSGNMGVGSALISIVNLFICFFAFYHAFKCGGGFVDMLSACCCSICYIAYRMANPC
jgi:hypothetical protein